MRDDLTVSDFAPFVGATFRLAREEQPPLDLKLEAAVDLSRGAVPEGRRAPFSIFFRGPLAPVMPQATYRLENEAFGALEIFIVPRGPKAGAMEYEAPFN